MTTDIEEARDWQGLEVDCSLCPHRDLLEIGRCELRKACVQDRYARRIDRFFAWNPQLADDYLAHPHFEVRAIAAKFANPFLLPSMLKDTDETVRWEAVRRLPLRYQLALRNDPHREVRIRIATLLQGADLLPMMKDQDYYVRIVVARKIDPSLLIMMIDDPEAEVRRIVAQRIDPQWLGRICQDSLADVRLEAAQRMSPQQLLGLKADPDWRVRYYIATRLSVDEIGQMINDADPLVAETARERIAGAAPTV
jgi:hypothetical protein